MEGVAVGGRVDRHRLDVELAAGADDANSDLAPVGDQDSIEHPRALSTIRFTRV